MFDVAIIGAGINGCAVSYYLTKAGLRVALIDKSGIASGGSGAAGAFIAPKFTKAGPLKALLEAAYRYAIDFYNAEFPDLITNAPLLHLAKYEDENEKVAYFKQHTTLDIGEVPPEQLGLLTPWARGFESVYLRKGGLVDAKGVCETLAEGAAFFKTEPKEIRFKDGIWHIGQISAKTVVLATGAYKGVVDEPYLRFRPVWGHRIDIKTTTHVPMTIHQQVSISPSREDGTLAIGATHNVHYHPESGEAYDTEAGRAELIRKACDTIDLQNIEVLKDYTGLRSGSNDYMPLLGRLVKAKETLEKFPDLSKGADIDTGAFVYYPNLFVINGTGGYGFVLGPYLAKALSEHITDAKALDPQLDPVRFFRRWAKRAKHKTEEGA
jgi:tRNA 5-methylaminomethyl-2-thiouridine biosynthesis bifunctional protein